MKREAFAGLVCVLKRAKLGSPSGCDGLFIIQGIWAERRIDLGKSGEKATVQRDPAGMIVLDAVSFLWKCLRSKS
jgi:hypothetical protein